MAASSRLRELTARRAERANAARKAKGRDDSPC